MATVRTLGSTKLLYTWAMELDDDPDQGPPDGPRGAKGWINIYRFNGEIAIPWGAITIETVCNPGLSCDVDPVNMGEIGGVEIMRVWTDTNGNGAVDPGEATSTADPFDPGNPSRPLPCSTPTQGGLPECAIPEDTVKRPAGSLPRPLTGFEVDTNLDMWLSFGGTPANWLHDSGTGIWRIKNRAAANAQLPKYVDATITDAFKVERAYFPVPAEVTLVRSIRFDAKADTLYVLGEGPPVPPTTHPSRLLGAFTHFSTKGSLSVSGMASPIGLPRRFLRNLPDPTDGSTDFMYPGPDGAFVYGALALAGGTTSLLSKADKLFVANYFGEVTAYEATDGAFTATLPAGPEISGRKGYLDFAEGMRAYKRAAGNYLVSSTDTGGHASVISYDWTPGACMTAIPCNAQDACRAYWKAEEGSGTQLVDATGESGATATLSGAVTWTPAREGRGISFPTGAEYGEVPNNSISSVTGPITMAAWVKPAEVNRLQYVLKKARKNNATGDGYELAIENTGKPFVRFNQSTSGDTFRVDAPAALAAGAWAHLAATHDGGMIRLYVNGTEVASKDMEVPVASNGVRLGIGAQCNFNGSCNPESGTRFKGVLDEIRLFARALPAEQIKILARLDPVGSWTFEDGSTTIAKDSSGACNDGYINGNVPLVPGRTAGTKALSFASGMTAPYVQLNGVPDLAPGRAFTVASWVAPAGTPALRRVVNKSQVGLNGYQLVLNSSGKPAAQIILGDSVFEAAATTSYPTDGNWIHLAATYDGKTLSIYYNKVLQGSTSASGIAGLDLANGLPLTLGGTSTGTGTFLGKIDDVRVYRRALSAAEILALP